MSIVCVSLNNSGTAGPIWPKYSGSEIWFFWKFGKTDFVEKL